jgi:hypothetical protein
MSFDQFVARPLRPDMPRKLQKALYNVRVRVQQFGVRVCVFVCVCGCVCVCVPTCGVIKILARPDA